MRDEEGYDWIAGDGGPLIVLQAGAVPQWRGAENFKDSLMQGGTLETDYDVICGLGWYGGYLHRYGQDMLVLSDSGNGAFFVPSPVGEVVILQWFGWDDSVEELLTHVLASPPVLTFPLVMVDEMLRLLVGAEDGTGGSYGFSEASITPGPKMCDFYTSLAAQVVVIRPAEEGDGYRLRKTGIP